MRNSTSGNIQGAVRHVGLVQGGEEVEEVSDIFLQGIKLPLKAKLLPFVDIHFILPVCRRGPSPKDDVDSFI